MKIVARLLEQPSGRFSSRMIALDDSGNHDESVTLTLLDFVCELPVDDEQFEKLLIAAESGQTSNSMESAAWSENDKVIWFVRSPLGGVNLKISNENVEPYSEEFGTPLEFSAASFRAARALWRTFNEQAAELGPVELSEKKFEIEI